MNLNRRSRLASAAAGAARGLSNGWFDCVKSRQQPIDEQANSFVSREQRKGYEIFV